MKERRRYPRIKIYTEDVIKRKPTHKLEFIQICDKQWIFMITHRNSNVIMRSNGSYGSLNKAKQSALNVIKAIKEDTLKILTI